MNQRADAKPFKELTFPASSKANPRVLANLLATHFAIDAEGITGTHREQHLRLKEPASLSLVLRREGIAFHLERRAERETDAVIDAIDQIELVLQRALGFEPEEETPEVSAPADESESIGKAIVSALMAERLVTFASPRSQPQLEKQLALALRQRCESVEEIAECIMECSGVAELHAGDADLERILQACMPRRRAPKR